MGMPITLINFAKNKASTAIKRSGRGLLLILIKEATQANQGTFKIIDKDLIPAGFSQANKDYILRGFRGGEENKPKAILVVSSDTVENGLKVAETLKFDYIVAPPDAVEAEIILVENFIKDMRDNKNIKIRGVLPDRAADHEGIINFTTDDIKVGNDTFKAAEYCSREASLILGTPLQESVTYKVNEEVTDVPKFGKPELDDKIDAGEFIIYHDGEKVKVARGVCSLLTITGEKTQDMKFIKIVDTQDLIYKDIKSIINDRYIGRVTNNYTGKLNLIVAIQAYFEILERDGLIESGWMVDIDVKAQTEYLIEKNVNVADMTEQQIREYNTGTYVFLTANVVVINAIEDVTMNIYS